MFSSAKRILCAPTAAACLLVAGVVPAANGTVLPSSSTPLGYSLPTLAVDTAVYNTGAATGNPATPAAPNIPFAVLEGDTTVLPTTYLYLPIFYADNSAPADPNFPAGIANQATDAAYLDSYVLANYDVSAFLVQIDGQTTVLNDSYIVGVNTPTLLDGTPGGTEYITSAAVLSPLAAGPHTIGFGGVIGGQDVVFGSYSVTSAVPEPGSIGLLSIASTALLRRRNRVR